DLDKKVNSFKETVEQQLAEENNARRLVFLSNQIRDNGLQREIVRNDYVIRSDSNTTNSKINKLGEDKKFEHLEPNKSFGDNEMYMESSYERKPENSMLICTTNLVEIEEGNVKRELLTSRNKEIDLHESKTKTDIETRKVNKTWKRITKVRNDRIFNNNNKKPDDVVNQALQEWSEYETTMNQRLRKKNSNVQSKEDNINWIPPSRDTNTDATIYT
ncbi:hypothetical protein ACH5RR_001363, partial [Cinchona calisaya]